MSHCDGVLLVKLLQSRQEAVDLSGEQPGALRIPSRHPALYDHPKRERPAAGLGTSIERLNRDGSTVIEKLEVIAPQCLVGKPILKGNDVDQHQP